MVQVFQGQEEGPAWRLMAPQPLWGVDARQGHAGCARCGPHGVQAAPGAPAQHGGPGCPGRCASTHSGERVPTVVRWHTDPGGGCLDTDGDRSGLGAGPVVPGRGPGPFVCVATRRPHVPTSLAVVAGVWLGRAPLSAQAHLAVAGLACGLRPGRLQRLGGGPGPVEPGRGRSAPGRPTRRAGRCPGRTGRPGGRGPCAACAPAPRRESCQGPDPEPAGARELCGSPTMRTLPESQRRVPWVWPGRLLAGAPRAALAGLAGLAFGLLSACAGPRELGAAAQNPALLALNQRYALAEADPTATRQAPEAWARAQQARQRALDTADRVDAGRATPVDLNHAAYLAAQTLTLAREAAASHQARAAIDVAHAEHDRLREQAGQARSERLQAALATDPTHPNPGLNGPMDTPAQRDVRLATLQLQLHGIASQHTERGWMLELGEGWFAPGHSALSTQGQQELARIALVLNANPAERATIEGHTDGQGSHGSNQALALRRADAVRQGLVALGVAADRLGTRALGDSQPAASNDTAEGRRANRRVEIYLSPAADTLGAP